MTNREGKQLVIEAMNKARRAIETVEAMVAAVPDDDEEVDEEVEKSVQWTMRIANSFVLDLKFKPQLDSPQGMTVEEILKNAGPPDKDGTRTISV